MFPAPPGGEPQWGGLPHAQIADLEVRPIAGGYESWMSCKSRGIALLTVLNPATTASLGCGQNPTGSLVAVGAPALGASFSLELDNPLGSQGPGAQPPLALSTTSLAAPCGVPLSGWNMDPAQASGEWLLGTPFFSLQSGPARQGSGQPASFALAVPAAPALIGARVYAQGALVDTSGSGPQIGLSAGLVLRLGL